MTVDNRTRFGMRRAERKESSTTKVPRRGIARGGLVASVCILACAAFGMLAGAANAASGSSPSWTRYLPGGGLSWTQYLPGGHFLPSWSKYLSARGFSWTGSKGSTGSTGSSGSSGASSSAPSTPTSSLPGKPFSGTYTGAGASMDYLGYVPSTYQAGTAVPLVVSLHGCTQTADVFRQLTRWDQLAEAKHFIVVFPQQSSANNQYSCWNFFQDANMKRGAGEPSHIAGLVQWVQQHYNIDSHRIYIDGLSAGGAMSSVLAATYPDLFAAAGIGEGCEYASGAACAGYQGADPKQAGQQAYAAMGSHARPMPVILFEGDQDTTVPPANAQQIIQQWQVTDDLADDGLANGSIPVQPTSTTNGQVANGHSYTVTSYSNGHKAELIQYWLVHGMAHAWSGGCSCEQYSDPAGPDETGAMYSFFMNHPMP
jgi:poly(hydroxyalkanoate) depolymerase family esterase